MKAFKLNFFDHIFLKIFFKSLLALSLFFGVTNINAVSLKDVIYAPKKICKGAMDYFESSPDLMLGTAITGFFVAITAATALSIYLIDLKIKAEDRKERDIFNKEIESKCVVCGKINEKCTCDLLQKLTYAFVRHGTNEKISYYNGWYTGRSSKWLTTRIKSVILKMQDVNMRFDPEGENFTLLHIACYYGHEEIIKWLIEHMFVEIDVCNKAGITPNQLFKSRISYSRKKGLAVGEKSDSSVDLLYSKADGLLIDNKINLQQILFDDIESLKNLFGRYEDDNSNSDILSAIKSKINKIKNSFKDFAVPGFSKQLVLGDLVEMHKKYDKFIDQKLILDLYKSVVFNYTFLNDKRFEKALAFAQEKNIVDICSKTVEQEKSLYSPENKGLKSFTCNDYRETNYTTTYYYKDVIYC